MKMNQMILFRRLQNLTPDYTIFSDLFGEILGNHSM